MSPHKLHYFNDDLGAGDISDRSGDEQGDAILFLHNRPTWDEVAQFMASSGIPSLDVKQVTIYELSDNSRLQVLGLFGKLQAEANLAEQGGDSKLLQHLLRWQIPQTNLSRTGEDAQSGPSTHSETSWLQTHDEQEQNAVEIVTTVVNSHKKSLSLTPRQLQILKLMSESATNSQIARDLKFSESTIRQETMAIYRFLAVPGRRDAVEEGKRRGLLGHQEPTDAADIRKGSPTLDIQPPDFNAT